MKNKIRKILISTTMSVVLGICTLAGTGSVSYGMTRIQEDTMVANMADVSGDAVALTGDAAKIASLHNPISDEENQTVEYSYVYFGSYPQSEVTGEALTEAIINAEYVSGDAVVGEDKYYRMNNEDGSYRYFIYEPIRWRVICKKDNEAILRSDLVLDCQIYGKEAYEPWVNMSLRRWLNSDVAYGEKSEELVCSGSGFLKQAFTMDEGNAINAKVNIGDDDYFYSARDKVYLLSGAEMYELGNIRYPYQLASKASDYAFASGVTGDVVSGYAKWWVRNTDFLRLPVRTGYVDEKGVRYGGYLDSSNGHLTAIFIGTEGIGVCPAIVLDLTKTHLWCTESEIQKGMKPDRGEDIPYEANGKCGENVYYRTEGETVYIYGSGKMYDYEYELGIPSPFKYKNNIGKVVIDEGIKSIGDDMFVRCENLKEVILPETVKEIGVGSFGYCRQLESINFPQKLVKIGGSAFEGCNLKEVVVPETVKEIGSWAFAANFNMTKIELPSTLEIINSSLCRSTALSEIVIPETVKCIGSGAFQYCDHLTEITIPKSVTSIETWVFESCENLTKITIPETVTSIGGEVFYGTKWLENKQKENPFVVVNGILVDMNACSGEAVIPANVKEITDYPVKNLNKISKLVIPATVEKIGEDAFKSYREAFDKIYVEEGSVAEQYMKSIYYKTSYYPGYNVVKADGTVEQAGSEADVTPSPEPSTGPTITPSIPPTGAPSGQPDKIIISVGDVNMDKKVALEDAQMVLKFALKIEVVAGNEELLADANEDGKISLEDAQLILKVALKIIPWDKTIELDKGEEQLSVGIAGESIVEVQGILEEEIEKYSYLLDEWEPFREYREDPDFHWVGNPC